MNDTGAPRSVAGVAAELRESVRAGGSVSCTAQELFDSFGFNEINPAVTAVEDVLDGEGIRAIPPLSQAKPRTRLKIINTEAPESVAVNNAGVGLALAGAALMLVAVFLPHVESQKFFRVADNTLIAGGDGWFLIALAVGIALAVWAATQTGSQRRTVLILGAIAIAFAVYEGTGDRVKLESVGKTPYEIAVPKEKAKPGTGVYAAGAGGLLALLGGALLAGYSFGAASDVPARRTKKCPDCAENVLADARVCKHCGYRFETG